MTDNPKDLVGSKKVSISLVPQMVLLEIALALAEGAKKYQKYNWRQIDVRATIYYDAAFRHLAAWLDGEDIDPDSGLSHLTKAIADLIILRDAYMQGTVIDDRPPKGRVTVSELNQHMVRFSGDYSDP